MLFVYITYVAYLLLDDVVSSSIHARWKEKLKAPHSILSVFHLRFLSLVQVFGSIASMRQLGAHQHAQFLVSKGTCCLLYPPSLELLAEKVDIMAAALMKQQASPSGE